MHKKYSFKKSLKGLIPFIKPYKWQFIIAILMIFAFNISMVLATIIYTCENNIYLILIYTS